MTRTIAGTTADRHASNQKFLDIAKLLGLESTYFAGMYGVRLNGEYLGQMSAEAWIDFFRNCAKQVKRS